MRKLALISTFCDDNVKQGVLKQTLQEYKKLGVDTMVYSPIKLPKEIENECNYIFYTDENPILTYPERGQVYWWEYITKNSTKLKLEKITSDYGWASNYQLKKLMNIGATYEYDIYYLSIYDIVIDNNVKETIQNNVTNVVSPNLPFTHSLQFTPFTKDMMIRAENFFDYSDYIKNNYAAEYVALKWVEELGMELSNKSIKDSININSEGLFNLSYNQKYSFFCNNDIGYFKIVFTEIKEPIKLKINDYILETIEEEILYEIPMNVQELNEFLIYNDNYNDVYTNKIKNNTEKCLITKI